MNDPLTLNLHAKLDDIAQTLAKAKDKGQTLNEAQTELVVLDPLLLALGYDVMEIGKQGHNPTTGAKPDYTVLPDTPHTWFLEGKRLDFTLTDGDAAQAVNYAHNHGARWAVLTNGRAWHIYDAHSTLSLPEKRVLQIADVFASPEAAQTLALLSRDAMTGGGILAAQALQKLNVIVRREVETPRSALRKSLQNTVQKETGGMVSDEAVGAALAALLAQNVSVPDAPVPAEESIPPFMPVKATSPVLDGWHTLEQLNANTALVTGQKPALLMLGGGKAIAVSTWRDVVQMSVTWTCGAFGLPPLPLLMGDKSKNYLLNTEPVRADGSPMFAHTTLHLSGQDVALNLNLSALNVVRGLLTLLAAVNAPLDSVRVELRPE